MNILNSIQKNNSINYNIKTDKSHKENKKRTAAASIVGSAIGIAGAVAGVYAIAKKGNPSVSLKNLVYEEKDVLLIGAGSVLGGLAGGIAADKDKKNVKPKLREASQQFFGNMVCPIGLMAAGNKILEKTNFSLPMLNSSSTGAKVVNTILAAAPKIVVTLGSLVCGMEIGNKIMNRVNDKIFNERVKHNVKKEDYLLHADDICLASNMLLKDAKVVSSVTSKILPATFIIAGSKTGMARRDGNHH